MEVTMLTWVVAVAGLVLTGLLAGLELAAAVRPLPQWSIENVHGSSPGAADPGAYLRSTKAERGRTRSSGAAPGRREHRRAQGGAMGILLALAAAVLVRRDPAVGVGRNLGFRLPTVSYWVVTWGIWPVCGVVEASIASSGSSNDER